MEDAVSTEESVHDARHSVTEVRQSTPGLDSLQVEGQSYIDRPRPARLTETDIFFLSGMPLPGTEILSFWRWAFSSLNSNTLRGDLMEWAVAHLLRIPLGERDDWAAYDLRSGKITIQVKQSSYLQGWAQKKHSTPHFGGLRIQPWDPETGDFLDSGYHCDWYVFALLQCTDASRWNPLDLDQWIFYIIPRATLERYNCKSIGLAALDKLTRENDAHRMTAVEL
jgi:hypothetical protein